MNSFVVVTEYVRSIKAYRAVLLADLLRSFGHDVRMLSLSLPESGLSRHWDSRVAYYEDLGSVRYSHAFYCPVLPTTYVPFSCLHAELGEGVKWVCALPGDMSCVAAELLDKLDEFDLVVSHSGSIDNKSRKLRNVLVQRFAAHYTGFRLGSGKPKKGGPLKLLVVLNGKLLRKQDSWHGYRKFFEDLLSKLPDVSLSLLLESTVSRSNRLVIKQYVSSNPRVSQQSLEYYSDYPLLLSQYDVVVNLNDPKTVDDMTDLTLVAGALPVVFGAELKARPGVKKAKVYAELMSVDIGRPYKLPCLDVAAYKGSVALSSQVGRLVDICDKARDYLQTNDSGLRRWRRKTEEEAMNMVSSIAIGN